jgi:hypothetical protein
MDLKTKNGGNLLLLLHGEKYSTFLGMNFLMSFSIFGSLPYFASRRDVAYVLCGD